jgi:streptogramin lyase
MGDLAVSENTGEASPGIVQRFDESGNLVPAFSTGGLYESVQDVTIGPDGTIYSIQNSIGFTDVTKLDPNSGSTIGEFNGISDSTGAFAEEPDAAAFGPDGFLYVGSTAYMSDGATNIFRINPTTGAATQYMKITGPVTPSWIQSLAFGPGNNLYFVDGPGGLDDYSGGAQILRYDPISKTLFPIISASSGEAALTGGIAFAPTGNLAVDTSNGIAEYATGGTFVETLVPAGLGGLSGAGPIVFGPDGDLYAVSPGNQEILRYNAITGQFLGTYVSSDQLGDYEVTGIAFVPEPTTLLPLVAGLALLCRRAKNRC